MNARSASLAPADEAATLEVALVGSIDELRALEGDWRALERASAGPVFFQSFAWCGHVAEVRAAANPDGYRPLVAVGRRAGRIVAVWPLSLQRSLGSWVVRNLDDPFGQFAGVLAGEAEDAGALVSAALAEFARRRLAGSAFIERIEVGDALHRAILAQRPRIVPADAAATLDLAPFPSFAELKKSRNRKSMKNLRNATNRLRAAGTSTTRVLREGAALEALIRRACERRRAWLDARGMSSPAFRLGEHLEILRGGASWGLAAERIGFELTLEGTPIAEQWGFLHCDRYYAYMSAFDPAFEHLSPGKLQLAHVIEEMAALGVAGIEMLTPASDYKRVWSDDTRALVNATLAWSRGARLRHALWDGGVRPALKAAYYALPAGIAGFISGVLHTHVADADRIGR
jgi:CelD/BcsL family acetyltransferase involved in cellulose biosynthesis